MRELEIIISEFTKYGLREVKNVGDKEFDLESQFIFFVLKIL
jgi:hypothetical protein